ncbi:beta-galactosidase [Streptomyces viridochromogenes]|uniref:beta-galactosidase n=1 Tax=Streptomyces viridochromogenes TaxID=1938 RepID=UPI0030B8BA5D
MPATAGPGVAVDAPDVPSPSADGAAHTVAFDKYSVLIDGRRVVLWSGEIHPFRLPSPSLWRDVLQKLRAHGLNTVGIYVAWNHHSSAGARDRGVGGGGLPARPAPAGRRLVPDHVPARHRPRC